MILLKNAIVRNWEYDLPADNRVAAEDRALLKAEVINVLFSVPLVLQRQLSEIVSVVCRCDFPDKWESLLPQLAARMDERSAQGDWKQVRTVLDTANAVFERYLSAMRSDALFTEIKYVLSVFAAPLLALFERALGVLESQGAQMPRDSLLDLFSVVEAVARAYLCLNHQDLPEFFEDTLDRWWRPFEALLAYENPSLRSPDPEEAGVLENVKAAVCRAANLYAGKYDEEFRPRVPALVQRVWNLLTSLGEETRYDGLVTAAVPFLSTVAGQEWNRGLFANQEALNSMCERVVIPQLKLRAADIELFEDDPAEYIRRDIEGSDTDTRRRTAIEFVRALCAHFEAEVSAILVRYVDQLMQQYAAKPAENWVAKDAAIFVVLSLAAQGTTARDGVTRVNPHVRVNDFLAAHVLPELQRGAVDELPVLKADCLKFVAAFRSQLPPDAAAAVFPLLVQHLGSRHFVVHTYAARAIDRLLLTRLPGPDKRDLVPREALVPGLQALLTGLFRTLEHGESHENEYVVRAILRVCQKAGDATAPLAGVVIQQVAAHLKRVAANPTNPQFNHYLFEVLACLVKNICGAAPEHVAAFEAALFPVFQEILAMESCEEFHPYAFQVIAQLLSFNAAAAKAKAGGAAPEVSAVYQGLWPSFLTASLWLNHGNVPALVALLRVYLGIGGAFINERLQPVLGIFQQLLNSKKLDHYGMELLGSVLVHVPQDKLAPLLPTVFGVLFRRLQAGKTPKYVKHLIVFFSLFVTRHGLAALVRCADTVQAGIMSMVLERVWLPAIDTVEYGDRRLVAYAHTRMLCEDPALVQPAELWPQLLRATIRLFEGAHEDVSSEEQDLIEMAQAGFSSSYNQLAFASLPDEDPLSGVQMHAEASVHLAQQLAQLARRMPGQLGPMVGTMGEADQKALQSYLGAAGVQLV